MNRLQQEIRLGNRRIFRLFLTYFLPPALIFTLILLAFDRFHFWSTQNQLFLKQTQFLGLFEREIEKELTRVMGDLYFLSQDKDIQGLISQPDHLVNQQANHRFLSLMRTRPSFGQLRILNAKGQEIYRINQNEPGKPQIVRPGLLQNKSNRPYFQQALDLEPPYFYLSPLSLNQERGKIEVPHVPVLRFVYPLLQTRTGDKYFLVVNLLGQHLLANLAEGVKATGSNLMLESHKGDWLASIQPDQDWQLRFDPADNKAMKALLRDFWDYARQHEQGTYFGPSGLFAFQGMHLDRMRHPTAPLVSKSNPDSLWKLVVWIPPVDFQKAHFHDMRQIYLGYAGLLLLWMAIAWNQTKSKIERMRSEEEKSQQNQTLRKRVQELNCLYEVGKLAQSDDQELSDILQQVVDLLPAAWQFPEIARSRMSLNQWVWLSHQDFQVQDVQTAEIRINGEMQGVLEVGYSAERPDAHEGPFLLEERNLLNSLAQKISNLIESYNNRQSLETYRQNLEEEVRLRTQELETANRQLWNEIQERKEAESQLKEAKLNAEEATRLKTRFLSLVAHDLKSPFISLLGVLRRIVKKETGMDPQNAQLLQNCINNGQTMLEMIEKLLNINMLQSGHLKPELEEFPLRKRAQEVINQLQPLAEQKGIELQNMLPSGLLLTSDPFLVGEVLANLLSNSIKFCDQGDVITLSISQGLASIQVKDTGLGISPSFLPGLFSTARQTSSPGTKGEKGTGLGLPYCADIMTALGGSISVESEPAQGTCFSLTFPRGALQADLKSPPILVSSKKS